MKGKTIVAVVSDFGGYENMKPVLKKALDEGCRVILFLVGTCLFKLEKDELEVDGRIIVIRNYTLGMPSYVTHPTLLPQDYDLLIVGAAQSREGILAGIEVLKANSERVPSMIIEDMYGSAKQIANTLQHNKLCVVDEYAKKLHKSENPGKNYDDTVIVTGGPQFDEIAMRKRTWSLCRDGLRNELGIEEKEKVFLVVGGVNGTAEMITLLHTVLKYDKNFKVIIRRHPRMTRLDEQMTNLVWNGFNSNFRMKILRPDTKKTDTLSLLPAVDFVLSGFSTVNHYGILYEMPGVIYVGTPSFKWDLWEEKGLVRPPQVDAGAAWYVRNTDSLKDTIDQVEAKNSSTYKSIVAKQKEIASHNDGKATERVWNECVQLMSN